MENKNLTATIDGKEYQLRKISLSVRRDNFELFNALSNPLSKEDKAKIADSEKEFLASVKEIKSYELDKAMADDLIKTRKALHDSNVSYIYAQANMAAIGEEKLINFVKSLVIDGEDIDWSTKDASEVMVDIFEQVKKKIEMNPSE